MNTNRIFLLAIFCLVLGISACDLNPDKPDTDIVDDRDPMITLIKPALVPIGSFTYYNSADTLPIEILFEDNLALKNFQIQITYNDELYYLKNYSDPMEKFIIGPLSGDEVQYSNLIYVDFDPYAGPYEFRVTAWDSAGNSSMVTTYIFVTNTQKQIAPTINAILPSTFQVDTFFIGEKIHVNAFLSDSDGLYDAFVRVRNTFTKELLAGSEVWYNPLPGGTSFQIDTLIHIPPTPPGDYSVEFYSKDSTRNMGVHETMIYIHTDE